MSLHSINWKQRTKVGCDPTVHEFQTFGQEPTLLAESPVHGFGVLVPEFLDHHEQHDQVSSVTKATPPRALRLARAAASPAACAWPTNRAPWSASGGCAPRRRWLPASAGRAQSG